VNGEQTSTSAPFIQFSQPITSLMGNMENVGQIPNFEPPTDEMEDYFDGYEFKRTPSDDINSGINRWVQIRSNENEAIAYSLTNDQNIIVTREQIRREPAGAQVSESVVESADIHASDIADYPEKESLVEQITQLFNAAKEDAKQEFPNRAEDISTLSISSIVITGEWGNGDAEFGVDRIDADIFVNKSGGGSASSVPVVGRILRTMTDYMTSNFDPTDTLKEWTGGYQFRVLTSDNYNSTIESSISEPDTGTVYNLTERRKYHLEPRRTVGYDVEPVEETQPQTEEQEEQQPEQPEQAVEEEPKPEKTPAELLAEQYPGIPPELRPLAREEGEIEVPINKDSKRVKPRPLYEFEQELMNPEDAGTSIQREITGGIGDYINEGLGYAEPVATFPRVGNYIRWHLLYQGPSYINEMYNDLVVYSAYISSTYGYSFKVMTYQSFREYIHRLKMLPEKGKSPQLIRELSQQQAAARGLTSIPTLPSGLEAPWLENKHYFEVVEENIDHPAWKNPGKALYEEDQ